MMRSPYNPEASSPAKGKHGNGNGGKIRGEKRKEKSHDISSLYKYSINDRTRRVTSERFFSFFLFF